MLRVTLTLSIVPQLRKSIRDQTVDLPGFSGVYSTPQNPPLNHWSPENPPTTPSTSEYSVSPPFPFHTVVDTLVLRGFFPPLVSLLHSVLLNAIPHPEYKEQLLDVFNALAFTSDGYALGARESSLFSTRAGNFPLCIGTAPRYCNHTTSWTCPDFVDVCVGGIRENLLNEGIVETLGGMFKKAVDDEVPADLSHALVNRYCEKVLAGASKDQDDKANDEEDEDALDNSKTTLVDYHIVLPESMSGDTAYKVVSNKHCIYGHSKYIDRLNKNKNKNKYSANVGSKIVLYKKNLGIAARALQVRAPHTHTSGLELTRRREPQRSCSRSPHTRTKAMRRCPSWSRHTTREQKAHAYERRPLCSHTCGTHVCGPLSVALTYTSWTPS